MYYKRIDISEGIHPTKSNSSKECMIWHYWFFNNEFKFQDSVCNGCHDLTMISINRSDVPITTVKIVDYRCVFRDANKSETIDF